nr:nuclear transport factor 2 family protein [Saprospiraceae bacterium]
MLLSICMMLLLSNSAIGQTKVIASLEIASKKLVSLLENPDEKELLAILSPHLVYSHSSGMVDTKETLVKSLVSGASDFVKIDITNQQVKKIGKSTYAITHNLSATTNNGGVPGSVKLFILLIWEK